MTETWGCIGVWNMELRLKITNSKSQITNKFKIRKNNDRNVYWFWSIEFGTSNLFVIWCLLFGAFSFGAFSTMGLGINLWNAE